MHMHDYTAVIGGMVYSFFLSDDVTKGAHLFRLDAGVAQRAELSAEFVLSNGKQSGTCPKSETLIVPFFGTCMCYRPNLCPPLTCTPRSMECNSCR